MCRTRTASCGVILNHRLAEHLVSEVPAEVARSSQVDPAAQQVRQLLADLAHIEQVGVVLASNSTRRSTSLSGLALPCKVSSRTVTNA